MAVVLSIASGKGGVGKSVVVSNLALLLARRKKRVVLVDLDVGGANIHVLFGMFHPPYTLTDFLNHRVDAIEKTAIPFEPCPDLRIIPGTGDTLATANMPYARKKRLISHIRGIDADVILVDVGAGTSLHALDFFLMGDHLLTVATTDPTSVLDLYRFIKLAAIRRVLSCFLARSAMAEALGDRDFASVQEVLEIAGKTDEEGRKIAEQALEQFRPHLILNRTGPGRRRVDTLKLKMLLKEYVGGDLLTLGEIPEDEAVERSIRSYLPVVESVPDSPSAAALSRIADGVMKLLEETPK